jgi:hypothetical protein
MLSSKVTYTFLKYTKAPTFQNFSPGRVRGSVTGYSDVLYSKYTRALTFSFGIPPAGEFVAHYGLLGMVRIFQRGMETEEVLQRFRSRKPYYTTSSTSSPTHSAARLAAIFLKSPIYRDLT